MIIISDCLTDKADEGTIKIASKLAKLLRAESAKVFLLNKETSFSDKSFKVGKLGFSGELIKAIKAEKGDILFIPNASMTLGICVRVLMLSVLTGRKIMLLPVYRRPVTGLMKVLLQLSGVELIVLSKESLDSYRSSIKNKIHYVKAGVDTEKFVPVDDARKRELRVKYGFDPDEKIILHVGHMVDGRNIRKLLDVSERYHVVLVVSTSTRWDENLYNDLSKKKNITIVHEYIENIEEYYQMADMYLFMVQERGCVDVPLSVLEASSCNKPVLATRFGELKELKESSCFSFIDDFSRLNDSIDSVINAVDVNTREMVECYEWKKSTASIVKVFEGV